MNWSKAKQRMAAELQAIERARKRAAEARLADARAVAAEAEEARAEAGAAVTQAECSWSQHLSQGSFNLELGQALGAQLVMDQHELERGDERKTKADRMLGDELRAWQGIEAIVRSGEKVLRRGQRELAKRAEAARDRELAERTTWKWFRA